MILESIPLVFMVVGAAVYVLAANPKAAEMGKLAYFAGMLVALFGWAHTAGNQGAAVSLIGTEPKPRGQVIKSRRWRKTSGATASIYGAVPWTGARGDQKDDWHMEDAGWTIQWDNGTVGIGRVPFATKEEAEAFLQRDTSRRARR